MINLSQETELLARQVANAWHVPVETAIHDALTAAAQGASLVYPRRTRDASPEAVARRRAAFGELSVMIAALPVLDKRPVHDIVDDLNAV